MSIIKTEYYVIYNDMPRGWIAGKYQPSWHLKVYMMWKEMWRRVYSDIHYFGSLIYPKYDTLSDYIKFIESQPSFEEFCNTCDKVKWCIDKDMKCPENRNYYPEYMILTTGSENSKERFDRRGNPNPKTSVIAISDNKILLFKSTRNAQDNGFDRRNLTKCINKKLKSYKGYKWFRVNYKHNKAFRIKE